MSKHYLIPRDRLSAYSYDGIDEERAKIEEIVKKTDVPKQVKKEIMAWGAIYNKVRFIPELLDEKNPIELDISVPKAASILGVTSEKLRTMADKDELELHYCGFSYLISLDELVRLYALKKEGKL